LDCSSYNQLSIGAIVGIDIGGFILIVGLFCFGVLCHERIKNARMMAVHAVEASSSNQLNRRSQISN
jgi:hypothetical protein